MAFVLGQPGSAQEKEISYAEKKHEMVLGELHQLVSKLSEETEFRVQVSLDEEGGAIITIEHFDRKSDELVRFISINYDLLDLKSVFFSAKKADSEVVVSDTDGDFLPDYKSVESGSVMEFWDLESIEKRYYKRMIGETKSED